MSRRILIIKKELQNLKKKSGAEHQDFTITLDFNRSREDTEELTGYPEFLSAIHEIAPDTPNGEWTEEQVQRACDMSGMCRNSISSINHKAPENITIQIHNRR